VAARTETMKAKDEIVALRGSVQAQVRRLTIAVIMLLLAATGAVTWMYFKARGG